MKTVCILLVDDEVALLDVLVHLFHTLDSSIEVVTASSASEAYDAWLARSEIALVLSDVQMPQGSGIGLARRLRAAGYLGVVVLMSGGVTPVDCRYTFLQKPIHIEDLRALVDQAQDYLDQL